MSGPLVLGAVPDTAALGAAWEGLRRYFAGGSAEMDVVLFADYRAQVEALLAGEVDIAWNTSLAWVEAFLRTDGAARALAMRDTDATFQTVIIAGSGAGIEGLEDLRGRRLALGPGDSGPSAILPVHYLAQAGLGEPDVALLRAESADATSDGTGRGELLALRALLEGRADAAAIGSSTWAALQRGVLVAGVFDLVWTSPVYSHCNFTASPTLDPRRSEAWVRHLLAMAWEDPAHRPLLESADLRRWIRPRLEGYAPLLDAVRAQGIAAQW